MRNADNGSDKTDGRNGGFSNMTCKCGSLNPEKVQEILTKRNELTRWYVAQWRCPECGREWFTQEREEIK
jgi:hypothetical protein